MKLQMLASVVAFMLIHVSQCTQPPHVLFIMVDDMGWNDVSFHGEDQIMTPNLDAMAYQGVILKQYYSEAVCTPTRAALLTGKYPIRTGMASTALRNSEDRGIPIRERLLPSYMKELGYSTHLVGKWHVGMSRNEYLPTFRGYDTHYGNRGGAADYFTHERVETNFDGTQYFGLDFFDGANPILAEELHAVDAFTDKTIEIINNHNKSIPLFLHLSHTTPHAGNDGAPLQQTPSTSNLKNKHIAHSDRRLYANMVTNLDDSFAQIIKALENNKMLNDTIIVFVSDNGAPTIGLFQNYGVNLPLRGQKSSPWEGGTRVPAFIWHSSLKPRVWDGLFHVTDWLPTLIAAGGGDITKEIDGVNQWPALQGNLLSERKDVLVLIDNIENYAAYRYGDYKILLGNTNTTFNEYYGKQLLTIKSALPNYFSELYASEVAKIMMRNGRDYIANNITNVRSAAKIRQLDILVDEIPCVPTHAKGCLYNIRVDPSESHDLWESAPNITKTLAAKLLKFWNEQIPRKKIIIDPRSDPAKTNHIWLPWIAPGSPEVEDATEIGVLYNGKGI